MADWLMPYRGILDIQRGRKAKCRVKVYEGPVVHEPMEPVVVLAEVEDNEGESIASAAEVVVGTLMDAFSKSLDLSVYRVPIFICHYPQQITGSAEAYELVTFEELEVSERLVQTEHDPQQKGTDRDHIVIPTVGNATFTPLDSEMVQALLGEQSDS